MYVTNETIGFNPHIIKKIIYEERLNFVVYSQNLENSSLSWFHSVLPFIRWARLHVYIFFVHVSSVLFLHKTLVLPSIKTIKLYHSCDIWNTFFTYLSLPCSSSKIRFVPHLIVCCPRLHEVTWGLRWYHCSSVEELCCAFILNPFSLLFIY